MSEMDSCGRSQRFLVRYTVVDFAKDFLKDMFFGVVIWVLCKLGRNLINWTEPRLREFMNLLELVFHYFACQLKLESPLKFLMVYLKYNFR